MFPPDPFAEPRSSFEEPTPVPASDPNAGNLVSVCFAQSWLSLILGSLLQLVQDTTWDTEDETELALAQARAQTLLDMFVKGWCEMTTGMIAFYAGATPPDGWLECNGQAISRACYAELFAVCGETFGVGDGSTTFNLPNMGGRTPVGIGSSDNVWNWYRGSANGSNYIKLTTAEMPAHTHLDGGHVHGYWGTTAFVALTGEEPVAVPNPIPQYSATGYASLANTGGDGYHVNVQPGLGLLAIIKT